MLRFLLVSAQIAVRALGRNRFRTVLTMLGVVIGVAAVIAMVALGSGARGSVQTSLKSAGTNIIQVSSGNYTRGGESMNIASGLGAATTLTAEDAEAIRKIEGIQAVVYRQPGAAALGITIGRLGSITVLVKPIDYERALSILEPDDLDELPNTTDDITYIGVEDDDTDELSN